MSTLPTRFIQHRIAIAGVPSSLSYSAGTYLCNCIMYTALDVAAEMQKSAGAHGRRPSSFCSGFIHVPVRLHFTFKSAYVYLLSLFSIHFPAPIESGGRWTALQFCPSRGHRFSAALLSRATCPTRAPVSGLPAEDVCSSCASLPCTPYCTHSSEC